MNEESFTKIGVAEGETDAKKLSSINEIEEELEKLSSQKERSSWRDKNKRVRETIQGEDSKEEVRSCIKELEKKMEEIEDKIDDKRLKMEKSIMKDKFSLSDIKKDLRVLNTKLEDAREYKLTYEKFLKDLED